jgi:pimeloyl-ACP methyl ester carboxylesterase
MTDHSLTSFYAAAASVAGALIGLLFVALTVAQERSAVRPVTAAHQIRGAAALTAFSNALVVSLFELIEGPAAGMPATVVSISGLTFVLASILSLRGEPQALRETLFLAWLLAAFAAQLFASLNLSAHPSDPSEQRLVAILVVASFLIGIARAWELVGGPTITITQQLTQLLPRAAPQTRDCPTPGASKPAVNKRAPTDGRLPNAPSHPTITTENDMTSTTSLLQRILPAHEHRPGTGPTLVFLHYWGGSSRTWGPVVARLEDRDILTIDFRGWGRSKTLPGPYSLHQLARDTLDVVTVEGVTDYILVGHSMGGKVAQLIAATRPDGLRSIVLVGSAPAKPAAEITPEYQDGVSHAYDTAETVAGARDNILTATPLSDDTKAQIVADSLSSASDAARTEWPLHGIAEDITADTRNINVPALVIAGDNDNLEPADLLRHNLLPYLSGADLAVIPNTGHLIPLEAPAELAQLIRSFAPAHQ